MVQCIVDSLTFDVSNLSEGIILLKPDWSRCNNKEIH